jgi:ABC-2 type transport system ATP-binding protein
VDPQSRNHILEGITKLNERGATIIYTTHYMEEVEQICTRISIMDKGKKVAEGTKDELKRMIKNTETIIIEILELPDKAYSEIASLPHVYDSRFENGKLSVYCSGGKHNLTRVLDVLQKNELGFGRVYTELPTLNDVFLEITGKALRDKEE